MNTSKIKNFQDYADRILPQPGSQADIDALENLPSNQRNVIVFVVAAWCEPCGKCIPKINELFATLLKAEHDAVKSGDKSKRPIVMVFDADNFTHSINALIADPEHHVSGYPGIVLFKGDKLQLHRSSREPAAILTAWQQI
jgi:hypothetical protein